MKRYLIELLINIDGLANLILGLSIAVFGLSGIWLLFYSDGAPTEKIDCARCALKYAMIAACCSAPVNVLIPNSRQLRMMTREQK